MKGKQVHTQNILKTAMGNNMKLDHLVRCLEFSVEVYKSTENFRFKKPEDMNANEWPLKEDQVSIFTYVSNFKKF